MELPLHIRYHSDRQHDVAGILIPGAAPAEWLNTVTCWGLGTEGLRFLVFQRNDATQGTEGVLVIGRGIPQQRDAIEDLATRQASEVSVLPICYRCIAERLYLPADAELMPHVTEAELRSLLPSSPSHLLVWHPTAGLIEFEPDQIPSVIDLLATPQFTETRWDGAQAGELLNDRIRSLRPQSSQDLNDILQQGQGDIGQNSGQLDDAPRSPDEFASPRLNDAIRSVRRWIARRILDLTNRPEKAGARRPPGRLQRWAARILGDMSSAAGGASRGLQNAFDNLSSERENELKRLLNLLEKDPDKGLRYALPFSGDSSRGAAPPSGRLGERTPDFNLRHMGGSGPADVWDIPWEYKNRLRLRYRDLAQREIRLGNHRRAAYIYATLLNDLHSAATALEAGGLFHDAATLYDKHLHNWMKAAECYRNGGFWEEALGIYQARERWIDAGELLLKMDEPDKARVMFSYEILSCEARNDYLKAGQLADRRLNDAERAAALFAIGWQHQQGPDQCFRALLELHGRLGQHAQARNALQTLAGSGVAARRRATAVTVCSEAATNYPDDAVRGVARLQTWTHASAVLLGQYSEDHATALAAVRALSKSDDLLQTDSRRFAATVRRRAERDARKGSSKHLGVIVRRNGTIAQINCVGSVYLKAPQYAPKVRWQSGVSAAGFCFLFTADERSAIVARYPLPKQFESAIVEGESVWSESTSEFSFERCQLRTSGVTASRVFLQQFPATSSWNVRAIEQINKNQSFVEILKPQPFLLLDFLQESTGTVWALFVDSDGRFLVEAIGTNGLSRQSIWLDFSEVDVAGGDDQLFRLHHDGQRLMVLTGRHVWKLDPIDICIADHTGVRSVRPICVVEFPETPLSMVASPPNTTPRMAFSFRNGAQVVWPLSGDTCAVAQNLLSPQLISTGNGLLVAACSSNRRIDCYRLNAGRAELVAERDCPKESEAMLNLLPGNAPNEFLVLNESGGMECFLIPVR